MVAGVFRKSFALAKNLSLFLVIIFVIVHFGTNQGEESVSLNHGESATVGRGKQVTRRRWVLDDGITVYEKKPYNLAAIGKPAEFEYKFLRYLKNLDVRCPNERRLGRERDGGWDVCMSGPYKFIAPCLVYSFGIKGDWSFDDTTSRKYKCTVRSFDPSIGKANHTRKVHGSRVFFYNMGIGGEDVVEKRRTDQPPWTVRKFSTMFKHFDKDKPVIDYFKMDVEGSEYDTIESMHDDGMLSKIKQIGLEVHPRYDKMLRTWKVLELLEKAGFRKWYFHANVKAKMVQSPETKKKLSCCYELTYININFLNHTGIDLLENF